jgi:hypothetical protein
VLSPGFQWSLCPECLEKWEAPENFSRTHRQQLLLKYFKINFYLKIIKEMEKANYPVTTYIRSKNDLGLPWSKCGGKDSENKSYKMTTS